MNRANDLPVTLYIISATMVKADNEANIPGVPNYDPAQMRRWALVVASVMSFLAAVAICLRLLCRRIRKQPLWWDDYLIMFSMVSGIYYI